MSRPAASISRMAAASKCRSTITDRRDNVLLSAVDLVAFLGLAVQFAIAGYFFYLIYWLVELPPADGVRPPLPVDLPHVLVQIPVYNEPLVVDRVLAAA